MSQADTPTYLLPYLRAVRRHGGGFSSLLWASPQTQAARFEAIRRIADLRGAALADIGCGRADLLDYLLACGVKPAHYVGLEVVDELADVAEGKHLPDCTIVRADFIQHPQRMFVGADYVVFSGSLNTLEPPRFFQTLRHAFNAATRALVFNFLDSPALAGQSYLHWHAQGDLLTFARTLTPKIELLHDYLDGDCTAALFRPEP